MKHIVKSENHDISHLSNEGRGSLEIKKKNISSLNVSPSCLAVQGEYKIDAVT